MYLPIMLGILVCWIIINSIVKSDNQKQERLEKAEKERQFEEARFRYKQEKQEGYYKEMIALGEDSITLFEALPKGLEVAEIYLNQAEVDFSDGAFAPFWDSVLSNAR